MNGVTQIHVLHAASLVRHAGRPIGQELDQLRAAHDHRPTAQGVLVQLASLEARGADVDLVTSGREVGHQHFDTNWVRYSGTKLGVSKLAGQAKAPPQSGRG